MPAIYEDTTSASVSDERMLGGGADSVTQRSVFEMPAPGPFSPSSGMKAIAGHGRRLFT